MKLHNLTPAAGSKGREKRIGRGEGGCGKEAAEHGAFLFIYADADKQRQGIYEYDYGKVICDLDMVGLDLHTQG